MCDFSYFTHVSNVDTKTSVNFDLGLLEIVKYSLPLGK